jgi:hypothetical protein
VAGVNGHTLLIGSGRGRATGWTKPDEPDPLHDDTTGEIVLLTRGGHRLTGRLLDPLHDGHDLRLVDEDGRQWRVQAHAIDAVTVTSSGPVEPTPAA